MSIRSRARRYLGRALTLAAAAVIASIPRSARAEDAEPGPVPLATPDPEPAAEPPSPPPPPDAPAAAAGVGPAAKSIPLAIVPHSRSGEPLAWDPSRRRFQAADWILTGTDATLALTFAIVKPLPPPWRGGVLFDESVRNTMRIKDIDARGIARDASDVLISLQIMGPFLIDSLTTAWWYRGSKDVAREMALIDLETLSVTAAVQGAMVAFTGRERPYGRTCGGELPENGLDCSTFARYRSYFSGHTSLAFTSAALVCQHHVGMHLFENTTTDVLSCVSAMTAAAGTGALRIMADQHYATDVLTGALVGTAIGFGVPYLLHGHRSTSGEARSQETTDFTLHVVPTVMGASAVGTF